MNQNVYKNNLLRNSDLIVDKTNAALKKTQPSVSHNYVHAATSENTRRAYQIDIREFIKWGALLPTSSDVVIRYLQENAAHSNPRTLARRLTAIKQWHLYQGFSDPTAHPVVRKTLTGIKNIHGKPKEKASPITVSILTVMVAYLTTSSRLIDCRNNALLQVGFFGAFRRSELVAIRWEDVRFVPEGVEILIPRSKTDQSGEGQVCAIPYGNQNLCPVTALKTWHECAGIKTGFVFRQLTKAEQVKEAGIKPGHVNVVIKNLAKMCQLPDADLYIPIALENANYENTTC